MKIVNHVSFGLAAAAALAATACIDPDSPLITESGEGCDEFGTSEIEGINAHPEAKRFLVAASDFTVQADELSREVRDACEKVAMDLGAENTWSQIDDLEESISNSQRTGACDAAGSKIEDVLIEAERVDGSFAILVSEGQCYPDFEEQAACDAECAANAECTPGTIVERCEPGALSVVCQTACSAEATCVGTVERPANCMGKCQSECVGECQGTCFREDGTVTENDPNCVGKCSASCNGTCRGQCKVEASAGIECGAEVRCTGGCSGEYADPVCVSEFLPPQCEVNTECHAACSAKVVANAECDPTRVDIYATVESTPSLDALVNTLEENLPRLIDAGEHHGKLLLDAARRLGDSGEVLRNNTRDLDGKSLACLGEAAAGLGETIGALDVSVNASVNATVKTRERMQ